MADKNNGKFAYFYAYPETIIKSRNNPRYILSLLCILIGILFLPKIAYMASVDSERLIELTNDERKKVGVGNLTANQLLAKAAYEKANAILETQTFQHNINDKKFSSWIRETGYQYSYVGENLAIDFSTCEGIIRAWSDSELHKKNLLNPRFTEIGIAVIEGEFNAEKTTIVVQIFGEPLNKKTGKVSGIDLNNLYYQEIGADSSSSDKMILSVNENFDKKHEILLLSLINSIDISTTTDLNYLLSLINKKETLSPYSQPDNFQSSPASVLLYWEKNLNFSNLIFLITIICLIFSASFAAAPALIINISQYYYKLKSSLNLRKSAGVDFYKRKIRQI